jgi:hypothetical protein
VTVPNPQCTHGTSCPPGAKKPSPHGAHAAVAASPAAAPEAAPNPGAHLHEASALAPVVLVFLCSGHCWHGEFVSPRENAPWGQSAQDSAAPGRLRPALHWQSPTVVEPGAEISCGAQL